MTTMLLAMLHAAQASDLPQPLSYSAAYAHSLSSAPRLRRPRSLSKRFASETSRLLQEAPQPTSHASRDSGAGNVSDTNKNAAATDIQPVAFQNRSALRPIEAAPPVEPPVPNEPPVPEEPPIPSEPRVPSDSETPPDAREPGESGLAHEAGIEMLALADMRPPLEPTDLGFPINLATALRLSDARPLVVAAAQTKAWIAEAQYQRARTIWLPEVDFAMIYFRHDGFGPDFFNGKNSGDFDINSDKLPLNQNFNWFYTGGGLNMYFMLTDAIYEPLATRQVVNSKRWDIQAAKNDAVLTTAAAYFNVHRSRGTYAAAVDVVERGHQLVTEMEHLSRDLIPRIEVNRARRMVAELEQSAATARQDWRTASADLTQVLRLDPRVVVDPTEGDHLQITIIDPSRPLTELMPLALVGRPELASQHAMIQSAQVRIRQERLRPLLPNIVITGFQTPAGMRMQFGYFGTGRNGNLNVWSFREDVSVQLMWQAEGFGLGNYARVKEQRGVESDAIRRLFLLQDSIAQDVTQSQARLQSAAVRVHQAERSLRQALITYNGNYEGLHQTRRFENVLEQIYRPQEAVIALFHLWEAYVEYFSTVADYNIAQFQLFHALGYPAQEVTQWNPPGEAMPVDLERPAFLPPVGVGPPPATQ